MKPYLSLWSEGYYKSASEEKKIFLLNCYKMSAFFLLKHYKEVHLITDSSGAKFLKKIPFTTVSTELDLLPKNSSILWSLGKLYSYKLISEKKEPFIHVDHDVFLVNKINENVLNSDIFVQNEEFYAFYEYKVKDFFNILENKYLLGTKLPDQAYNMGIFGGQNTSLINKFSTEALKLPLDKKNLSNIVKTSFEFYHTPACIIEQYQLSIFLEINKIVPKCLIDLSDRKSYDTDSNKEIISSRGAEIKYFHLWGDKENSQKPEKKEIITKIIDFGNSIFN